MKAEAIVYASRGIDVGVIAEMVECSDNTIREWLADWLTSGMCSVLTGHAGNQSAVKLTRAQKQDLKTVLALPPSQAGVDAEFGDVPALRRGEDSVRRGVRVRLFLLAAPAVLRVEFQAAGPVRQAPLRTDHYPGDVRGENSSQPPIGDWLGGLCGR